MKNSENSDNGIKRLILGYKFSFSSFLSFPVFQCMRQKMSAT